MSNKNIDYRLLLLKYINLVGDAEGVTFINHADESNFTPEEITELKELDATDTTGIYNSCWH